MAIHPDTLGALLAAIRAELAADPSQRGYAGKSAGQIAALMNAPVVVAQAPQYRDVPISDVEGYLAARLVLVGLDDWIETAPSGIAKQAARQLVQIIRGGRISVFLTSDKVRRESVFGLFALLTQAGAGGLTLEHYSEIVAMALAPPGPPIVQPPRWGAVIDGISGVGNDPGPPNAATEALIEEALADGNG